MADIEKTIEIIFGATDTDLNRGIAELDKGFDQLGKNINSATKPLAELTTNLVKLEAGIIGLGVALLGVAVNEAATFNEQVATIGALFNANTDEVQTLQNQIQQFGSTSVNSFDNITKATFNLISATGDTENAIASLTVIEQAAVVGAADLNTAVTALTAVTGAFGNDISESERILGAFIVAVQNGRTTLPELSSAIGQVASTASASGVSIEEMLSAVSALTLSVGSTSQATTALNAVLSELSKPTDSLTVALNGATIESVGLDGIFKILKKSTNGSQVEMTKLFGSTEATKAALILANDASGGFEKTLVAMGEASTVVAQNFSLLSNQLSLVTQTMQNNLTIALQDIGQELLPEWTNIVEAVGEIFRGVDVSLDEGTFGNVFTAINSFQADISVALRGIAAALPEALGQVDFSQLIGSFEGLSEELGDVLDSIFGDDLDFTKPEDLAQAIQRAVNLLTTLTGVVSGIISEFQPIFDAIGEAATRVAESGNESDKAIGKFLAAVTAINTFGVALGGFLIILAESETQITSVFNVIEGAGKIIINTLQTTFDSFFSAITTTAAGVAGVIDTITFGTIPGVVEAKEQLLALAEAAGANAVKNFGELSEGIKLIGSAGEETAGKIQKTTLAIENTGKSVQTSAATHENLADKMSDVGLSTEEAEQHFRQLETTLDKTASSADDLADPVAKTIDSLKEGEAAAKGYRVELDDNLNPVFSNVSKTITGEFIPANKNAATQVKKLTDDEKFLIKQTQKTELALEKFASNERIKTIEFNAKINVAELESETARIEATMETLQSVFTTTGEVLNALTAGFDSAFLPADREFFKDKIEEELKLRRDTFEETKKINQKNIELINERLRALREGRAEIEISADNLAPELQAVLRGLVDNIRIEALNNGLEILV